MGRRGNNDWMRKEIDCILEVRQAVCEKKVEMEKKSSRE